MDLNSEYIDVNDALNRVGGNMDLYKRLLKRFIEGNQMDELSKALESGNPEEGARLAHTVKGVAANLSLIKLRDLTADMELIIKDGLDHTAKLSEIIEAYGETEKVILGIIG